MRLSTKKSTNFIDFISVIRFIKSSICTRYTNNDVINTPDVVVTATRTEMETKVIPNTVEVITQEDIQKLGATDVASALRLADNINITTNGSNRFWQANFYARYGYKSSFNISRWETYSK